MPFNELIKTIRDGEPVTAGVAMRPIRVNTQNINYLRSLILAAEMGQALFARDVTVEAEAGVGTPVYFNPDNSRYERGLAEMEISDQGAYVPSSRAFVWGIVYGKTTPTKADLLVAGFASLDISGALIGETSPSAGVYYLSSAHPGFLVKQRPPVALPVLMSDGAGKVLLMQQHRDFLHDHVHYRFELVARPAGVTAPPVNDLARHVITEPDSSRRGWLPADNSIFEGKAPAGAAFGYNLFADPSLDAAWPPIPVGSASLEWNRGETPDGYVGVPLGPDGLCVLNSDGIWWMSNCRGDAPWPVDLETTESESTSADVSESIIVPECPRDTHMKLQLWFTKMSFATDETVVQSIRSASPRLQVTGTGCGEEVCAGHITLTLDLNLQDSGTDQSGYLAVKEVDEDGTMRRGPVVEGLLAGSGAITLSSDTTKDTDEGTLYQGQVTVEVTPYATQQLSVSEVRLGTATEEHISDVLALGLRAGIEGYYWARLSVPSDIPSSKTWKLKLRFELLGTTTGTLPALTVDYRLIPKATTTPASLPTDDTELTLAGGEVLSASNQYVLRESAEITVEPGDTLLFKVTRASSDGFSGDVDVIHQDGFLRAT